MSTIRLAVAAYHAQVEFSFVFKPTERRDIPLYLRERQEEVSLENIKALTSSKSDPRRAGMELHNAQKASLHGLNHRLVAAKFSLVYAGLKANLVPIRNNETGEQVVDAESGLPQFIANGYVAKFAFERGGDPVTDHDVNMSTFHRMVASAVWNTKVFDNPYFRHHELIEGRRTLHFRAAGRTPVTHPDGRPVLLQGRDKRGAPIGPPRPVQPQHMLQLALS